MQDTQREKNLYLIIQNFEYLNILRRKTMEKVIAEEIKEGKKKQAKWVAKLGFAVDQMPWKCAKKRVRVEFITT